MRLRPWELDALDEMESARLRWLDRARDESGKGAADVAEPMTLEDFDALFG